MKISGGEEGWDLQKKYRDQNVSKPDNRIRIETEIARRLPATIRGIR